MALVLPALTDCRWWFESVLLHSGVSSATRRKATGADQEKKKILRSSLLPTCGFHTSFQTWPCHALTPHQVSPPRLGPATFLVPIKGHKGCTCHILTFSKAVSSTVAPAMRTSGRPRCIWRPESRLNSNGIVFHVGGSPAR